MNKKVMCTALFADEVNVGDELCAPPTAQATLKSRTKQPSAVTPTADNRDACTIAVCNLFSTYNM